MTAGQRPASSGPFRAGDRVQLTGPKGRLQHDHARARQRLHTHRGVLAPRRASSACPTAPSSRTASATSYLALRPAAAPTSSCRCRAARRSSTRRTPPRSSRWPTSSPARPSSRPASAPARSSLWLLRAIGPSGRLASFERREEFADVARGNVDDASSATTPANWTLTRRRPRRGAARRGGAGRRRPGRARHARAVGVHRRRRRRARSPAACCSATSRRSTQLSPRRRGDPRDRRCSPSRSPSETMVRGWHVEGLAVRPDHRMVAHTGFLSPRAASRPAPCCRELKRRASKSDFSDEDVEPWTPGALGEREQEPQAPPRKRARAGGARSPGRRRRATSARPSRSLIACDRHAGTVPPSPPAPVLAAGPSPSAALVCAGARRRAPPVRSRRLHPGAASGAAPTRDGQRRLRRAPTVAFPTPLHVPTTQVTTLIPGSRRRRHRGPGARRRPHDPRRDDRRGRLEDGLHRQGGPDGRHRTRNRGRQQQLPRRASARRCSARGRGSGSRSWSRPSRAFAPGRARPAVDAGRLVVVVVDVGRRTWPARTARTR